MAAPRSRTFFCRSIPSVVPLGIAGLGLALQLACERPPSASPPPAPPVGTIVSLSPVATRFAVQLGAGARLVGVDAASSRRVPAVAHLPVVDLASAGELAPTLVLVPALPPADDPAARALDAAGVRLVEFAPHDLEDVFALCRGLGAELVGVAAATQFESRIARPLALVGGQSPPRGRLRVVAVVGFEPLTLAGGHSFETDLIEVAGGSSATHGGTEPEIPSSPERWAELAPDLVLVATSAEMTAEERAAASAGIPDRYPVEFFRFDRETFWLNEPEADARRLRDVIAAAEREIGGRSNAAPQARFRENR